MYGLAGAAVTREHEQATMRPLEKFIQPMEMGEGLSTRHSADWLFRQSLQVPDNLLDWRPAPEFDRWVSKMSE